MIRACWVVLLVACGAGSSPLGDGGGGGDDVADDGGGGSGDDGGGTLDDAGIDAPPDVCLPRDCASPNLACGMLDDGCGQPLACGACPDELTCGATTPNVCGIPPASRTCAAGWCWEHPLPFGMNLNAVWGAAANNVWAVGDGGTIVRYNGAKWTRMASGTDDELWAVWGTAATNIWLGGRDYTRRFDGATLVTPPGAPQDVLVEAIRGVSATDLWVVGRFGNTSLNHWNGSTWQGNTTGLYPSTLLTFTATSAWAFGSNALEWNGTAWATISAPDASALWGKTKSDVWAARYGLHHHNGTAWTTAVSSGTFRAIDGVSGSDLWAGGDDQLLHYDGTTWTPTPFTGTIQGIWTRTAADAWAVGTSGRLMSWNGTTWTERTHGARHALVAATAATNDDVTLVGAGLLRWRAGTTSNLPRPVVQGNDRVSDAWGATPDDIWAAAGTKLLRWNGARWTASTPITDLPAVTAIWGTGADNIYAVTQVKTPFQMSEATLIHWDGTRWQRLAGVVERNGITGFYNDLVGVAGRGNNIWIVSEDGVMYQWNGTQLSGPQQLPAGIRTNSMYVSPSNTVYAMGNGQVYKKVGTMWQTLGQRVPYGDRLSGTSDTDLWFTVSFSPVIARWSGAQWVLENTGLGQEVARIVPTARNVFVVGTAGGLVRKSR